MAEPINPEEKFEKYPIIQRKPYADHLTAFLTSKGLEGYVLNLNSEWGAGKTTFLKCWYNELKCKHPVIYFDAWKSDFSHDPMTALIECFHSQLVNPISDNKKLIKNFFEKGTHFVKKAIPSLAVGYLKHKTGMPEDESLVEDITSTFGIDIAEKECGDALKDVLKTVLEQRQKMNGIKDFKIALEKIAEAFIEASKSKEYPIYILIDELDRCRPNYSIEVIESVKHFFNTKNFIFVIATDSEQLQHSIKAVYGSGFDANLYLSRFFDLSVTLPSPVLEEYIKVNFSELNYPNFPNEDNILDHGFVVSLIEKIFIYHGISSLREVKKILLALNSYKESTNKRISILSILTLIILKKLYPELYLKLKEEGTIPYRNRNSSSFESNGVSGKQSVQPLKIANDSYPFEFFLNNCISEYKSSSTIKNFVNTEEMKKFSQHQVHMLYKNLISHIVFNLDGDRATAEDYISLVELSFISD
jgi:hypothetical protein